MNFAIPELPYIQQLTEHAGVYVFPDEKGFSSDPRHAMAGPFSDARGARLWILESLEAQLTDARRAVWVEVCKRLGKMSLDLGTEFFAIDMVLHGKRMEEIAPYLPSRRMAVDHRMAAAGDEAA